MGERKDYWFPAKTYGWGWGAPTGWRGWLVLLAYLVGLVALVHWVPPAVERTAFVLLFTLWTAALLIVCWAKGEPPAWRWGQGR